MSEWVFDVCSSDLGCDWASFFPGARSARLDRHPRAGLPGAVPVAADSAVEAVLRRSALLAGGAGAAATVAPRQPREPAPRQGADRARQGARSDERRGGKRWGWTM